MGDTIKNLDNLFRLSPLPVAAVKDGFISYSNPAAETMFSKTLTGIKAEEVFPRWPYEIGSLVSANVLDNHCIIAVSQFGSHTVLTITRAAHSESLSAIPAGTLSGMANSITALRMAADKLVDSCPPGEKQDMYISVLYHNYYKLLRTAEHLSAISGLKNGSYAFEPNVIELGCFLADMVSSVRYLTENSGVSIKYDAPTELITVRGDIKLLEQMVLALVANSLAHTPEGGTIELKLSRQRDSAAIAITDNGSGMAPDVLAQAFRISSGSDRLPNENSGLGLPLASVIAEKHKGTVIIESRPGEGTCVRVLLRSCDAPLTFHSPTGGYGSQIPTRALTELSSVLPREQYTREKLK